MGEDSEQWRQIRHLQSQVDRDHLLLEQLTKTVEASEKLRRSTRRFEITVGVACLCAVLTAAASLVAAFR